MVSTLVTNETEKEVMPMDDRRSGETENPK